jgi:hypothetical protein
VRVELHPEARAELRAAAIWYDEQRPGLGDEFIAEISSMLDKVGELPASFQIWPGTSRCGSGPRHGPPLRNSRNDFGGPSFAEERERGRLHGWSTARRYTRLRREIEAPARGPSAVGEQVLGNDFRRDCRSYARPSKRG